MTSLRLRLLKWLIGPILLLNIAGGALMYLLAWLPAQQAIERQAAVQVAAGDSGPPAAAVLAKREETRSAILRALVPVQALLTLAVVGLIWFSVTTGLLPLDRLRSSLKSRDGEDLSHLDPESVPRELEPVVGAFNELLDKVAAGAQARHDFLADVAHQLRTPLAGLTLQLEWLAARHAGDAASAHSIGLMQALAERMTRQTNQLLALARAEPGQFEQAELATLDLAALVAEPIQYFVDRAARKRIDLGFELERAEVQGDRFLLRDLADNLIDNALRYTPEGGTVTVRVHALGEGGAEFSVEDSGPGIAPEARASVFARGVRLNDKAPGSGLGLAIVRAIARAHGASIDLGAPAGGSGAIFTVRFPRR